ncbi:MAG: type II toxin-antitoxin system VapC family toxin [Bryobacteraceae bacterium]
MLIPDINILMYAYNVDSPHHGAARTWWETSLSQARPIGMPWAVLLGFIRIATSRQILINPLPAKDAIHDVRAWLDHPRVRIVNPGDRHAEILFHLLTNLGVAGNLTTDAHLAALAIEYQAELVSADTDFSRFPGLRWCNPLASRH